MRSWFTRHRRTKRTAQKIYGSIVARARAPAFYQQIGVPDTIEGRFELLVLHLFVVLERLRRGEGGRELAQELVDTFFADMDVTLRETGVGDLAVPKRMRRMAAAFDERLAAYAAAFDGGGAPGLDSLLETHLGGGDSQALGDYVLAARAGLSGLNDAALQSGALPFPALDEGEE